MTAAVDEGAVDAPGDREVLLELAEARKLFPLSSAFLRGLSVSRAGIVALDGINLRVRRGEVVGIVGESGSGKSTLALAAARLLDLTSGAISYRGEDITRLTRRRLAPFRRRLQMVFQDTHSSLNPRTTAGRTLHDALRMRGVRRSERNDQAVDLLAHVGLRGNLLARYPHELSGGQRQRVGIARALAMRPELLVADEPVSSVDVSLQAQILNLLMRLRAEFGLTMIFISHDLAVVNHVSSRVAVMYMGRIVELGAPRAILFEPAHPYTQALRASVPSGLEGRQHPKEPLRGETPDPSNLPRGCRFVSRCPRAMALCREVPPPRVALSSVHMVECHLYDA